MISIDKGKPAQLFVFFAGLYRGQDASYDFLYFTTMGKKGPESISAYQVVMDPGPVCIICELYLDNTHCPQDNQPRNILDWAKKRIPDDTISSYVTTYTVYTCL